MDNSADILIIQSAQQHAKHLNTLTSFDAKWNSASGQFFRSLTVPHADATRISAATLAAILFQLGQYSADSGFNFSLAAHLLAGVIPLGGHGKNPKHHEALKNIEQGSITANAMTEAGSGGDSFKMKTSAIKVHDGYLLNGAKTFVTNGPIARYLIVYALTNSDKGFFGGISCFLIDKTIHSVVCGPPLEKTSLKNSPMSEVFFTDCVVGSEYMIGKEGAGAIMFLESMDWERSCIAAMHAGAIRRLCTLAAEYVKSRYRGDKALSEFQGVQFKLAELAMMSETAYLMAERAARLTDKRNGTVAAAQAKIMVSEFYIEAAKLATELHGGNGLTGGNELTNVMSDAQAALIYSGPNDLLRDLIASRL